MTMLIQCLFFLCGFIHICGSLETVLQYEIDLTFQDKHCPSNIMFTASATRATQCMSICSRTQGCYSAIFRQVDGTCYGLNSHLPCGSFSALSGAKYYRRKCGASVAMVTGAHGIEDSAITATSVYDTNYVPQNVRLNGPKAWAALMDTDVNQYVQFNFGRLKFITGITTQGTSFPVPPEWTKTYQVFASTDCITFTTVTSSGSQIFTGNTNANSDVNHTFQPSFVARCVRVNPRTWQVWPTIRVEIMGCILEPTQ